MRTCKLPYSVYLLAGSYCSSDRRPCTRGILRIVSTRGTAEACEVTTFEYLGAVYNLHALCDSEIEQRLIRGHERMGQLTRLWKSREISNRLKARLIQTLVWPIVTYGSESWTIKKHMSENIEAFEMWRYRRAMRISYVEHVSNDEVLERVSQERLLAGKIKSQKLPGTSVI